MKRFIIAIAAVLVVSAAWMGGWFYIAGLIRSEITLLAQADGVNQPRLTCGRLGVRGAPFTFAPYCENALIVASDTTIDVAALSGTALFYRPTHIQLFATGPARMEDAFTGAAQEVNWSNLHASVRLDSGILGRFSLIADDIVYSDVLMGTTEIASATRGEIHLVNAGAGSEGLVYDFYGLAEGIDSQAFEIAQGRIVLDGQVTGLPDPALWGDPYVLAYWQAGDGELTLREITASAENLAFAASGAARLSEAGMLEGALDIESRGLTDRVAALADPSVAQIFLGSPDDSGVSRQRLRVDNGNVVVGILPVFAVPPLF